MTKMHNLDDMFNSVEKLREIQSPEVPKELLESIINAEADNQDSRSDGRAKVEAIVKKYLDELV